MNASEAISAINQRLGTSYKIVGRYGQGESGAISQIADAVSKVIDEAGNRYVLKIGKLLDFNPKRVAESTQIMRRLGYPAPEYVAHGAIPQSGVYTLQREMRGEPIGQRVSLALLPQLLALNDLQRGQGESNNDHIDHLIDSVMVGYPNFCNIHTLRTYSVESATMLDSLQRIVTASAHECPQRNDIVHFDFHTNNVLMEHERVTGVIDWEGSRSGDCAFDLATMLFYTWPFEGFRDRLWRALLERTSQGAVAIYLAHMIVRQLDWSMPFHDAATVANYMNVARAVIREIEQL
jgi:hypothetical protein